MKELAFALSLLVAGCSVTSLSLEAGRGHAVVVHQLGDEQGRRLARSIADALAESGWSYSLRSSPNLGAGGTWVVHKPDNEQALSIIRQLSEQNVEFKTLVRADAAADVQVLVGARAR